MKLRLSRTTKATAFRFGLMRIWAMIWIAIGLGGLGIFSAQGQPTKEYIRLNGRVVAIESRASGDFSITSANPTVTLSQGQSQTVSVTVTPTGGFTGTVTLSPPTGLPTGVTGNFSPASVTLNGSAVALVLTLTAASNATTGTATVTLSGSSGGLTRTATIALTTALPPDFSLSPLSSVTMNAGNGSVNQTASVNVVVNPINGFNTPVALSVNSAAMPAGVSLALGATSVSGPGWATTLTITTTPTAVLGTVAVTVTGTSGGRTRTQTFQLTVVAQPSFTMSAPSAVSVVSGMNNTVNISLAKVGNFSAPVVMSAGPAQTNLNVVFAPQTVASIPGSSIMTIDASANPNPGTYTYTIQGQSSSPAVTRTQTLAVTVTAPQQQLSAATITPSNGSEVTISNTATDPAGAGRVQSVEYSLSTSTGSNTFNPSAACRFRVNRAGTQAAPVFTMDISNTAGNGWTNIVKTIGTQDSLTNGVCEILLGQSSVTQSGANLAINIRMRSVGLSGTHYLRGTTSTNTTSSLPQPYAYLGGLWNVPAPASALFSNSQGVTPPVLYSGFNVTVTMTGANLGSNAMTLKLAQANDGALSPISGINPISVTYSAGNSGQDRDVIMRGLICSSICAPDESNKIQEYTYTIRVLSSTSSPPSLNFVNPFSGSPQNPSPINSGVTANGTTPTFINFGVQNTPYAAAQCTWWPVQMCTPIQNLYLNINRNFSESSLAQDKTNGCRLRVNIFSGSNPPGYYFWLTNDAGDFDTGFMWIPFYGGGGSIENSQCRLNINSNVGAYAQWPSSDSTTLGIGIQYVFKTPFKGTRYVFMMGNRNTGDWTGWQYRGVLNLQ
ncbi:MAG: hypothetical protein ACK555_04475 [Acidobacteriota bacterium]